MYNAGWVRLMTGKKMDKKSVFTAWSQGVFSVLLFSVASLPLAVASPEGGVVTGGAGSISQTGTNTAIQQNTQNMAIDWQSYNVDVDERVQYIQPNQSSISLNNILSNGASEIRGHIDANGQVILVNPNGVFFTPTSVINVGGIIASGLKINTDDFMNGRYIFNEVLGTDGTVIHRGTINAALGGNVALIGQQVENDGVIVANLGSVSLAAGKQAVLTFDPDGLLGVRVSKEILQEEVGLDPAVINSGDIEAEGGRVLLTASTSQNVFSQAVNTGAIEQASSVVVHEDGSFTLGGGADVINTGSIDVSTISNDQNSNQGLYQNLNQDTGRIVLLGENITSSGELRADVVNGNGGEIELHAQDTTLLTENSVTSARSKAKGQGGIVKVLGDKVGLFDQASVDASGANGGGQVFIGGDQEGHNVLIPNAEFVYLSEESQVFADALDNGDGGRLITFATDTARIYGDLFARGGVNGGDGGFIETSGLLGFQIVGAPDASAYRGEAGTWLIDPYNITVTSTTNNNAIDSSDGAFISDGTGDAQINVDNINDALNSGADVIIRAQVGEAEIGDGNITFDEGGDINYEGAGARTLTLDAAGGITFKADSAIFDGASGDSDRLSVVLLAGGAVTLEGADGGQSAASITTQGGAFTVGSSNDPVASFTNNGTVDTSGNQNQDGGDISIYASGVLTSTGLNANGGNTGTSSSSADNKAGRVGGNITLDAASVSISGAINTTGSAGTYKTNGGGDNGQDGGNGGAVSITTSDGDISVNAINTSGGEAAGDYSGTKDTGNGGDAGSINLDASSSINLGGGLTAQGARGYIGGSDDKHGSGNNITLNGDVVLVSEVNIDTAGASDDEVDSPGSYGDVTFKGAIAGINNRGENLAVTAKAITFEGAIANADTRLGDINLSAEGVINAASFDIYSKTLNVSHSSGFTAGNINTAGADNSDMGDGQVDINANTAGAENSVTIGNIDTYAGTGVGSGAGYVGGAVYLTGRAISVGSINTSGGDALGSAANYNGGAAGIIQIKAHEGSGIERAPSLTLNGDINATGGAGVGTGTSDVTQTAALTLTGTTTATVNINHTTDFTTAVTLTGSDGTDTLNAANRENNWLLTLTNSTLNSTLNSKLTFTNIETLIGNVQKDHFTLPDSGAFSGTLDGGGGTGIDEIQAGNRPNRWNITDNGEGTVTGLSGSGNTFTGIETLTGNVNADDFIISAEGSVSGVINGGDGIDSLTGRDINNTWNITSTGNSLAATGGLAYVTGFTNIETLTGGNAVDIVTIDTDFTGTLKGNAGNDIFNINADVTGIVEGDAGDDVFKIQADGISATLEGGATGTDTDRIIANNSSNTTVWTIDSDDGGSLKNTLVNTVTFSDIENITGGTGADDFTIADVGAGAISGIINGGGGVNTLTGRNVNNTWTIINGTNSLAVTGGSTYINRFTNINILSGGNAVDIFNLDMDVGDVRGGAGDDIFNISKTISNTLSGNDGNDTFIVLQPGLTISQIEGGSTSEPTGDTLVAADKSNYWLINANGGGAIYSTESNRTSMTSAALSFSDIENLTGNNSVDDFLMGATGSISKINGGSGAGANTLTGRNFANTWTIDTDIDIDTTNRLAVTAGSTYVDTFTGITTLTGGSNVDTFTVNSDASIDTMNGQGGNDIFIIDGTATTVNGGDNDDTITVTGTVNGVIDGGAGANDALILNAAGDRIIQLDATVLNAGEDYTVNNIEEINADGTTGNTLGNTLRATNADNIWTVSATPSLSYNGNTVTFSGFDNLTGGTGSDVFNLDANIASIVDGGEGIDRFNITSDITGTLNGNAGDDIFTFQTNSSLSGLLDGGTGDNDSVDMSALAAVDITLGQDIVNIESITGNGSDSTLSGENNPTTWTVDGDNSGSVSVGSETLMFAAFNQLIGGSDADIFTLEGNGVFNGSILAGAGNNHLQVTLTGLQNGQLEFLGGADDNSLSLTGVLSGSADYEEVYKASSSGGEFIFTNNGNTYGISYSEVDNIQDDVTANLSVQGSAVNDTFQLAANSFVVSNSPPITPPVTVNYTNKTDLTIVGLGGEADEIILQGVLNIGGRLTLSAEKVSADPGNIISAKELMLNGVNSAGSADARIFTNISSLYLTDSGSVYLINELNALTLAQMSATGVVDILAADSVNNSASLVSDHELIITSKDNIDLGRHANQLSGPLSLFAAGTVSLDNSVDINLASVIATTLNLTTSGNINSIGKIAVSGTADLTASGGDIAFSGDTGFSTLNVAGNNITLHDNYDIEQLDITATGNVNVSARSGLGVGNITANHIQLDAGEGQISDKNGDAVNLVAPQVVLRAGTGITDSGGGPDNTLETQTAKLDVFNATGFVGIKNTGDVTLSQLVTQGNIDFINSGNVTVDTVKADDSHLNMTVSNGSIVGTSRDYRAAPDITANSAWINASRDFGTLVRPVSVKINTEFVLFSNLGSVYYFGGKPDTILDNSTIKISIFDALLGLSGQQLIEVETLSQIDPAIFTEVRNYYQDEIAILLPADQRYEDDEEDAARF